METRSEKWPPTMRGSCAFDGDDTHSGRHCTLSDGMLILAVSLLHSTRALGGGATNFTVHDTVQTEPTVRTGDVPAPELLWRKSLPLQPVRVTLLGRRGSVLVGMRNCPDDTHDNAWMLDSRNGSRMSSGGLGVGADVVAARRSPDGLPLAVAATGWDKASTTTTMQLMLAPGRLTGDGSQPHSVSGDPAMWCSTAIAEDGRVGAILYEPAPDTAHLNNRSCVLQIFNGICTASLCQPNASWELRIDGLGATDPQEVAISAEEITNGTRAQYIIAAIMGSEQVIVAFDLDSPLASRVVYRHSGGDVPAESIAVSADGSRVAITDDAGVIVLGLGDGGTYSQVPGSPIKPPAGTVGLSANVVAFDPGNAAPDNLALSEGGDGGRSNKGALLAVGWNDADGTTLAVSLHGATTAFRITKLWEYVRKCQADGGLNLIQANGLQISQGGKWIVAGSWGCGGESSSNALVFRGGVDGNVNSESPLAFEGSMPGQVWAASVDAWVDSGEERALFAFSSWSSAHAPSTMPVLQATKAELAVFSPPTRQPGNMT